MEPTRYAASSPVLNDLELRDQVAELLRELTTAKIPDPTLLALCELASDWFDAGLTTITGAATGKQQLLAQAGDGNALIAAKLSLSDETAADNGPLLVPDLGAEPRFRHLPEVSADNGYRFYAGVPLSLDGEMRIGALNLYDYRPRHFSDRELERLNHMAGMAARELANRLAERKLRNEAVLLGQAAALSRLGSWMVDLNSGRVQWSKETYAMLDVQSDVVPDAALIGSFWTDQSREPGRRLLDALFAQGRPLDEIWILRSSKGALRRFHVIAKAEMLGGLVSKVIGSIQHLSSEDALESGAHDPGRQ